MKKMQSNFTTQEQSKRLLELGLPEWTADCYFRIDLYSSKTEMCFTKGDSLIHHYTPCWSVGRLIEIHLKCCTTLNQNDAHIVISRFGIETGGLLQNMYDMVGECALLGKYDFSKLEE